jgi:transcription-repair coupling factor (superfamily II helicase)
VRVLPAYADALERLRTGGARLSLAGGVGALPGLVLRALGIDLGRPVAVVVADEKVASAVAGDLRSAGSARVFVAPSPSLTPYQRVFPSLKFRRDEIALLSAGSRGAGDAFVLPARALFAPLPEPAAYRSLDFAVSRGERVSPSALASRLDSAGYRRCDLVVETGDFAARGGILDVFPPDVAGPLRFEFEGDVVASIRAFDPDTQRSAGLIEQALFGPMAPFVETDDVLERLDRRLGRRATEAERALFAPAVAARTVSYLDFLADTLVAMIEPLDVERALAEWQGRLDEDFSERDEPLDPGAIAISSGRLEERLRQAPLLFDRAAAGMDVGSFEAEETTDSGGRVREAVREMISDRDAGVRLIVAVSPTGGAEKVRRLAAEYEIGPVETVAATLSAGFRLRGTRVVVRAEEEIFGEERLATPVRRRAAEAFASDLRDLVGGDFVVHVDYGIGVFRGLKRIGVEGIEHEFMEIGYADGKILLLPVERFDLVQKYASAEGSHPKLDRLGSATWQRTKERVRKAVRDLSEELLRLYARRSLAEGFAFSRDSPWQKEFEDAFEYDETPDQEAAIRDVKRDMESPKPMDRLLCGDVGYGKTEVAMRAAFKAVLDGKQVAVLAPTTILAYQHYRTFLRRFAAFPVTIELLSRFRSRPEQKAIVEKIAEGSTDILIATHRVLGRDLEFKDLGLLIVDEEQRFGVRQKERLKELKASVDVLAMSATPIPRSLNLSLLAVRDLSVIETPPRDRLAIETQVVPFRTEVIKEAIEFELGRGGQVFFVHNRIESIGGVKSLLQELMPSLRIAVGHGEMQEKTLEQTMLDFIGRKYDLLLATAIIENGIDIPSVNTILIDRAETFGLSQLYQLRGRVGRSDKPAYAYLLIPEHASLSETARKRLATIREFCALGAGFRIAAKDLEIRGAGNILGAEQSGHIAAVGFELYLDLLEETVRQMRGEEVATTRTVTLSLGLPIGIPASYVSDENIRMMLYKKIARAGDDARVEETSGEIVDRFGPMPGEVRNLIEYARIRFRAERLGLVAIRRQAGKVHLHFDAASRVDSGRLADLVRRIPGGALSPRGVASLPAPAGTELLPAVARWLSDLLEAEAA